MEIEQQSAMEVMKDMQDFGMVREDTYDREKLENFVMGTGKPVLDQRKK